MSLRPLVRLNDCRTSPDRVLLHESTGDAEHAKDRRVRVVVSRRRRKSSDKFFTEWDDAMDANVAAVIGAQDAVVLGRRSYDGWAGFWPSSEIEPFATFHQRGHEVCRDIHVSISVVQTLLAAHVVDELRLVIASKIVGSGRRLLEGLPPLNLEPITSATSPTGHLLVAYRIIR